MRTLSNFISELESKSKTEIQNPHPVSSIEEQPTSCQQVDIVTNPKNSQEGVFDRVIHFLDRLESKGGRCFLRRGQLEWRGNVNQASIQPYIEAIRRQVEAEEIAYSVMERIGCLDCPSMVVHKRTGYCSVISGALKNIYYLSACVRSPDNSLKN